MKKLPVLLLTVVLLGVAGCGAPDVPVETESSKAEAPVETESSEAEAPNEAESSEAVASAQPTAEPTPQPELAASLEDIVGTWEGIKGGGGSIQIEGEGAWVRFCCSGLRRTAEIRFEGTRFFIIETASEVGTGEICVPTGIYEIQLLADGNLKFVAIEDECEQRRNALQGAEGINVEWKPVP
jgi:hypothetical protein